MSVRELFDVVRKLTHTIGAHGVALCACSAEHVRGGGDAGAYARELTGLARAITAELHFLCECRIVDDGGSGQVLLEGINDNGAEMRLFAEALRLVGEELEGLRPEGPTPGGPTTCPECGADAKGRGGSLNMPPVGTP